MSTVAALYGSFLLNQPPYFANYAALATPNGTLLKPGGRVAAYLRSTGVADGDDAFTANAPLVTTLNQACAYVRSGKGDTIYVLPGHAENISSIDQVTNLVAGTQIIGCTNPLSSNAGAFTWTAATATFLLDVADVVLMGLRFNFNGADAIAAPITVSAAGCSILGCAFNHGSSSSLDSLVGVTVSAADFFTFASNMSWTTSTATMTNVLATSGACDNLRILNNRAIVPMTSTNGAFQIGNSTNVISNLEIAGNKVVNKSTGSAGVASFTDQAHTGMVYDNFSGLTANTAPLTTGIVLAGTTNILVQFDNNRTNDGETKGTSGILSPAVNDGT